MENALESAHALLEEQHEQSQLDHHESVMERQQIRERVRVFLGFSQLLVLPSRRVVAEVENLITQFRLQS